MFISLLLIIECDKKIDKKIVSQKVCPVMGDEIDKALYHDYDGKRIYVCCAGCLKTLKKKPQKYVLQLESQGIKLKKIIKNEEVNND